MFNFQVLLTSSLSSSLSSSLTSTKATRENITKYVKLYLVKLIKLFGENIENPYFTQKLKQHEKAILKVLDIVCHHSSVDSSAPTILLSGV